MFISEVSTSKNKMKYASHDHDFFRSEFNGLWIGQWRNKRWWQYGLCGLPVRSGKDNQLLYWCTFHTDAQTDYNWFWFLKNGQGFWDLPNNLKIKLEFE